MHLWLLSAVWFRESSTTARLGVYGAFTVGNDSIAYAFFFCIRRFEDCTGNPSGNVILILCTRSHVHHAAVRHVLSVMLTSYVATITSWLTFGNN